MQIQSNVLLIHLINAQMANVEKIEKNAQHQLNAQRKCLFCALMDPVEEVLKNVQLQLKNAVNMD